MSEWFLQPHRLWLLLVVAGLTQERVLPGPAEPDRPWAYLETLREAIRPNLDKLCADCHHRFETNALRVFDCKNESCQAVIKDLPTITDSLDEASRLHFEQFKAHLDARGIAYTINPRMVRGLDYYTRTAFEIVGHDGLRAQNTLVGGGRYDGLIELMGGPKTPSVGWAAGVERLADLLRDKAGTKKLLKVGILTADEIGEVGALALRSELLQSGCEINLLFGSMGVGKKFKKADKLGLQWVIILGEKEIQSQVLTLKNLSTGLQSEIPRAKVSQFLFKEKNGEPAPRADS